MTSRIWLIPLTFLIGVLLFSGCGASNRGQPAGGTKLNEIERIPAEEEKAKLLKRIDRQFEDPEAHFELGRLYHADGLWAKAEYEYNAALNCDPAHRSAQAAMVKVFLDSGDKAKSEIYTDICMNQVASSAAESLKLAIAFQNQGLDEYALACYRQALRLAPNSAKVNRQIGYYYLSKQDKVQAQEYLTRSFQLNPNQPEVAGELGRLGVAVSIPRKGPESGKKVDRIFERAEKENKP